MSSPVDKALFQKIDTAKSVNAAPPEKRNTTPSAQAIQQAASRTVEERSPALEHRTKAIQRIEQYTAINESIAAFHLSRTGMSAEEEKAVFTVLENSVRSGLQNIQADQVTDKAAEELNTKLVQNLKALSTTGIGELHSLDSHRVYTLVQE